jgi:hypothetical protein
MNPKEHKEYMATLTKMKVKISKEIKEKFEPNETPLPRKYFYQMGLADEHINSLLADGTIKDKRLTWKNLVRCLSRKRKVDEGYVKTTKKEKYYLRQQVKEEEAQSPTWKPISKNELKKKRKEYKQYLETPHWKKLRIKIIMRDGFSCKNCNIGLTPSSAQVHHLNYKRVGCELDSDLVTLCRDCHKKEHGK